MHTLQVCGDFTGAAFEQVVDVPVVVRQGSGLDAQTTVEVPQLQFLAKVVLVVVQRQVLWSKQCRTLCGSSQLQFLDKVNDVPVKSTTRAHGGPDTVLGLCCCRARYFNDSGAGRGLAATVHGLCCCREG